MSDVAAGIAEIIGEVVETDPPTITPASNLVEDLGVDSLAMIEVVIGVEQRLGVIIADDAVAGIATVADLTSYVESRVAQTT